MLRISERFGLKREFLGKGEISELDIIRPVEISPPDAIYKSPGGILSEDFLPERVGVTRIPKPIIVRYPPLSPAFEKRKPPPGFIETKAQVSTPAKNFIDIFFDWLNKILSGK